MIRRSPPVVEEVGGQQVVVARTERLGSHGAMPPRRALRRTPARRSHAASGSPVGATMPQVAALDVEHVEAVGERLGRRAAGGGVGDRAQVCGHVGAAYVRPGRNSDDQHALPRQVVDDRRARRRPRPRPRLLSHSCVTVDGEQAGRGWRDPDDDVARRRPDPVVVVGQAAGQLIDPALLTSQARQSCRASWVDRARSVSRRTCRRRPGRRCAWAR